jgi:hypothetical protein
MIMLTGRISVIQIVLERLLKHNLALVVSVVVMGISALGSAWSPLSLSARNPNRMLGTQITPWLALILAFTYSVLAFLLQIFLDMKEYADFALEFVLPWNYRWQVPSPLWSKWWGL